MSAENRIAEIDGSRDYTDFVHTGPGTLAGRYLRTFWHPVYRSQDLPLGRAVPVRVMSEDFTLYRGEGGAPHLVAFRCAHRATQLSTGWVEGDCLRCFYHGWKYDGTGQCVEMPAEDPSFPPKVQIRSYPVEEYLDLIFAYLGEGTPPPLPRYPELETEGVLEVATFVRGCNYFVDLENACDPEHVTFVHRGTVCDVNGLIDFGTLSAHESEAGITITFVKSDEPRGLRSSLFIMPNIQLITLPPLQPAETSWRNFLSSRVPVDDAHYVTFNCYLAHVPEEEAERYRAFFSDFIARTTASCADLADAVLEGKARIEEVAQRAPNVILLQDEVAMRGQGRIPDRRRDHLGRGDVGVILLRKIWQRELRALAEGRSLKQWTRPPELVATTGVSDQ